MLNDARIFAHRSEHSDMRAAFTLVELLVVVGIIVILIGLLLPSLLRARWEARSVQCASNIRQICIALHNYASAYDGKLPHADGGDNWCDVDRIGQFIAYPHTNGGATGSPRVGGGAFVCPEDEQSVRSFALNIWAASAQPSGLLAITPKRGTPFSLSSKGSDRLILISEAFAVNNVTPTSFFAATETIGAYGATPGLRFGGGGGISPPLGSSLMGRFAPQITEMPYYRHRRAGSTDMGAVHLGFADGHVMRFGQSELVNVATGRSTLAAWWSPLDPEINP